jgi:hypothetical protein
MTKRIGLVVVSIFLFPWWAQGQISTASLQGTVTDQTGAAIPGVVVMILHTETGASRTVVTDDVGRYVAVQLPIGVYEVRGAHSGFQTAVRRGVTLTVGRQAVIDLTLNVGPVEQVLEVTAEPPLVNTTSSALSELVGDKTMRELPLNGRNFAQLAALQVGVVNATRVRGDFPVSTGPGMKLNVNGARDNGNSFRLDGQDIQDVFNSTPASGGGETLGVETLAEFEVKTANYSAEYGKAAGAVISAVTKSGTNRVHGSAFGFLRNDNLDAANFFDNKFNARQREFHRSQFGVTAGGPLIRDRTFIFGGYEGIREDQGFTQQFIVPSLDARRGLLPNPTTGQLEPVAINANVQPILDSVFLLPNGRDFGDGRAERIETRTRVEDEDFFVVKVDHRLSGADSLSVRYSFDDGRFRFPSGQVFTLSMPTRNQFASIQEQRIFSPTILNTFQFGFNRSNISEQDAPLVDLPPVMFFGPIPGLAGVLVVGGLSEPGSGNLRPRTFIQNALEWSNTTAITRGAQMMKFGVNVERFQGNFVQNPFQRGIYTFASLRDFLGGRAASFQGPLLPLASERGFRQTLFGFFAQDDIRVRPGFTLNLGLRYEFITVPTEVNGRVANVRHLVTSSEITVGDPFFKNPGLWNFAPRIGLAWDVFGDATTSVRAGFGVFHNQVLPNIYRAIGLSNRPFGGGTFQARPPFPNAALGGTVTLTGGRAASFPFEPEQPANYQWNLTIEREVASGWVTSVGYVGTRGLHLPWGTGGQDKNLRIPTIVNGRKFFTTGAPRRNPSFSFITDIRFDANSFYHGFQTSVRRRSASGLQVQASYTLAKSIDEASGIFFMGDYLGSDAATDPWDTRSERGFSAFDARHVFVANFLYPLPVNVTNRAVGALLNGWHLTGIVELTSALPFTVFASGATDRDRDGSTTVIRPDLVPGASNNPVLGDPNRWFDPSAFALPEPGFYGTLGRNTLRADAFQNFDLGLQKNIRLGESVTMQFRAEFFNLLNHANFQIPSVRTIFIGDSRTPLVNSGEVTETANPARQIQFGLKILW